MEENETKIKQKKYCGFIGSFDQWGKDPETLSYYFKLKKFNVNIGRIKLQENKSFMILTF